MLILHERHTSDDLRIWRELQKADRSHSHSHMLWRNYRRCQQIAREFIEAGPCYVAVSWGKDSVLTAHLCLQIDMTIPLRWTRIEPIKNPDCLKVRDAFLRTHPETNYAESEQWCRQSDDGEWHQTGTLERGIAAHEAELGTRCILGIRADESSARHLRVFGHGPNTPRRSAPLAYLRSGDVFALLDAMELPVHPAYAMSGGGRWARHHLRVDTLTGTAGDQFGRREWEIEYYGDVLRRLHTTSETPSGRLGHIEE